ncbi:hypothetical protein L6164_010162 [Bauhinia variegata]|uniref:Uncharacterized protein n=1 Tax=Bauhinia variegata TaxID=167791 RepID=A0ACB9PSN3_BAUVA|nr:hypothetical protein L6164_010162 [Bauhinia variegata]
MKKEKTQNGVHTPITHTSSHHCRLDTELFEDTLVLHSPLVETQVENFNLDTEIVEDSEPTENMTTVPLCEYEQEVVIDSEDEQMHDRKVAAKVFKDDETVRNALMDFQKRQLMPSCEQTQDREAHSNATTLGKSSVGDNGPSTDAQSSDDKNCLLLPEKVNHERSPEPGELTQAIALEFVDQFVSFNSLILSQGIPHRMATREKSPSVPSARGPQNLANKIKLQTPYEEKGVFRWVDNDQNHSEGGSFSKKTEASSNFGGCVQTYMRKKKGCHPDNQGNRDTCKFEDKIVQEQGTVTKSHNTYKDLDVQPGATRENAEACFGVTHAEDMPDIGLDTQIAAEAMETLAYVSPADCHFNDAHHPGNKLDDSQSDATENKAHLQNCSHGKKSGLKSMKINSKKRNVSACNFSKVTSSSCNHTEKAQHPFLRKIKKNIRSKSSVDKQFGSNTSSPISNGRVSLEEGHSQGDYINFTPAKETKTWDSESKWTGIKDQSSSHRDMNNNVMKEGIPTYKRKWNDSIADHVQLSGDGKCWLPKSSRRIARKGRLNCQIEASAELSSNGNSLIWHFPKGPRGNRKRPKVQGDPNGPTNLCTQSTIVNAKEINTNFNTSQRSTEGQDDISKKSSFPYAPLCDASNIETGKFLLKGIKVSDADNTCYDLHKKPVNKNLPKTSLVKELIRLAVSESRPDRIWKDLRQRRDMTYVRVMFSQHLDDSIIKQQKKILARLNVSVASTSMEATHFIADKFTRTKNMLETMALGKFVVTHLWLESCGQANCFIDEKNYILRDVKKEKEIGFNMAVSLARARQQPLLKGKKVFITPHVKPDKKVMTTLVTAVHGQVVDESQMYADKNDEISDDLLILSCEEDYTICHPLLERGIAIYCSELVLNGIVTQKLELERHQLFMNQIMKKQPRTFNRFGKVYRRRCDRMRSTADNTDWPQRNG